MFSRLIWTAVDVYNVDLLKNVVSDTRGSYVNHSYIRCLLIDFETVDCSVIGRWLSVDFQDGELKPEIVFLHCRNGTVVQNF